MSTAATLVQEYKALVSLPEVYFKVRDLMDDPSSSINDFTQVVEVDTALAARVLRMANSAFFGFSTKIDNISKAINIMGVSQLHDLVLSTSATSAFKGLHIDLMDMHRFWSHSIHCAVYSRLLAAECQVVDSDRLFVTGLLHDIGHLLMYSHFPEQCADILQKAKDKNVAVEEIEQQVLGFDAAEVGAELLHVWLLPDNFVRVVGRQNTPDEAEKFRQDTCILHLAKKLYLDSEKALSEKTSGMELALEVTGLSEHELQVIVREARLHYEETCALIMPSGMGKAA